ncbi:unnamed protein product [Pipistrellus nathusii]|uniref:Uncharacterized protein n=1 Tax=Pipistrellus nathusii TaxID=59473 RepID=A0ABN9ZW82_PIPNA
MAVKAHVSSSDILLQNLHTHFKPILFSSVHICAVGGNKGGPPSDPDRHMWRLPAPPPGMEHRHPPSKCLMVAKWRPPIDQHASWMENAFTWTQPLFEDNLSCL